MIFARLLVLSSCALALVACQRQDTAAVDPDAGAAVDLQVREQRASYAVGLDMANNFKQQGLPLQTDAFIAGLGDGLAGEGRLEGDALAAALDDFRALMNEHLAANAGPEAEANLATGREFCARNAKRDEVTVTPSGLQYEVLEMGSGPHPTKDDTVRVHYRGTTIDGEVFDESYGGDPATFGVGQVIRGWTEGLQLMPVGSKFTFWIPAELAYGASVPPGASFGPNSTLVFEVELLEIVPS